MEIQWHLPDDESASFVLDRVVKDVWSCFPSDVPLFSYIPETKDMSSIKHGIAVKRMCLGGLVTMNICINL